MHVNAEVRIAGCLHNAGCKELLKEPQDKPMTVTRRFVFQGTLGEGEERLGTMISCEDKGLLRARKGGGCTTVAASLPNRQ